MQLSGRGMNGNEDEVRRFEKSVLQICSIRRVLAYQNIKPGCC